MSSPQHSTACLERKSLTGIIAIFLALSLPSFVLRSLQLIETGSAVGIGDLGGFAADLIVICGVISLLIVLRYIPFSRIKFLVFMFIPIFWCSLTYGNYEHIKALGAMSTWAYIGFLLDPTFVNGSLLQASRPILLGALLVSVAGLSWYSMRQRNSIRYSISGVFIVLIPSLVIFAAAFDSGLPDWRKNNHFIHNITWAQTNIEVVPAAIDIKGLYPLDLDGAERVALSKQGKNVLLVILEGISGAYLDRVASAHSITGARPRLPALDKFGDNSLVYLNFFNHQRQTNRGLYSLLCGDLPRQRTSTPKMSEFGASGESRACLPQVLKEQGYRTAYIQSAPLAFMGKDKFMPIAGFEEVYGTRWFAEKGAELGKWGVNDHFLLDQSVNFIEEDLNKSDKPWFLSILSAGTHHPFMVPESFQGNELSGSFSHAVEYLNFALENFFSRIEELNLLDDTLVIITSDESFGRDQMNDLNDLLISQAFGSLTIATPEGAKGEVIEPFLQMDIPLSILDYLGLTESTGELAGRSVFRKYANSRPLPFANTYLRTTAVINEHNVLTSCEEDLTSCESYQLESNLLMSSKRAKVAVTEENMRQLKQITQRSYYTGLKESRVDWKLIDTDELIPLSSLNFNPEKEWIKIFANQYFSVPANSTVRVELDFDVLGDDVDVKIKQRLRAVPTEDMPSGLEYTYLMSSKKERKEVGIVGESGLGMRPQYNGRDLLFEKVWRAGEARTLTASYSYTTEKSLEILNCMMYLKNKGLSDVSLKFRKASLVIEKAKKEDKEGLDVVNVTRNRDPSYLAE